MKKLIGYVLVAIPVTVTFIGGAATDGLAKTVISWLIFGVAVGMILGGLSLIENDDDA